MQQQLQTWEQKKFTLSLENSNYLFLHDMINQLIALHERAPKTLTEYSERELRNRLFDLFIQDVRAGFMDNTIAELSQRLVY